ncbi:MAG: nucleoside deaminase [Hyphomicrobiales bacterium]|nr:nucleoside deaminase [Hyphomicrobiales bacterium]MDE2114935.1 nucleoside deaminase [Hyphomicrobiales bacterium]
MTRAFAQARQAEARGEVPIGAALVLDGRIVAEAGNLTRAQNDCTAHAEMEVIRRASKVLGQERLTGCDLYVTLEPCPMCAAAISFARIRRLYFAALDPKGGAVESGVRLYNSPTCHHAPEVVSGLRASEAESLLQAFFATKR